MVISRAKTALARGRLGCKLGRGFEFVLNHLIHFKLLKMWAHGLWGNHPLIVACTQVRPPNERPIGVAAGLCTGHAQPMAPFAQPSHRHAGFAQLSFSIHICEYYSAVHSTYNHHLQPYKWLQKSYQNNDGILVRRQLYSFKTQTTKSAKASHHDLLSLVANMIFATTFIDVKSSFKGPIIMMSDAHIAVNKSPSSSLCKRHTHKSVS